MIRKLSLAPPRPAHSLLPFQPSISPSPVHNSSHNLKMRYSLPRRQLANPTPPRSQPRPLSHSSYDVGPTSHWRRVIRRRNNIHERRGCRQYPPSKELQPGQRWEGCRRLRRQRRRRRCEAWREQVLPSFHVVVFHAPPQKLRVLAQAT